LIGDLNEDGHLDVLLYSSSGDGSFALLLGRGDGTFAPGPTPSLQPASIAALVDLNHDGHLDFVGGGGYDGNIDVALGNGDGTFQQELFVPAASVQDGVLGGSLSPI
jgi:hypothetical protein